MNLRIGDVVPLDYPRTIEGELMASPVWFALTVPANKENAAKQHLKRKGIHSCYPEREVAYRSRGKRHKRTMPVIARVVYAKFHREPQWDVMKARKLITGVYCYENRPIAIPGDVISQVMGLPTEAEKLEAARREMLRVREGDAAEILDGPMADMVVNVTAVRDGRVWWETLTGIRGTSSSGGLVRLLPGDTKLGIQTPPTPR